MGRVTRRRCDLAPYFVVGARLTLGSLILLSCRRMLGPSLVSVKRLEFTACMSPPPVFTRRAESLIEIIVIQPRMMWLECSPTLVDLQTSVSCSSVFSAALSTCVDPPSLHYFFRFLGRSMIFRLNSINPSMFARVRWEFDPASL